MIPDVIIDKIYKALATIWGKIITIGILTALQFWALNVFNSKHVLFGYVVEFTFVLMLLDVGNVINYSNLKIVSNGENAIIDLKRRIAIAIPFLGVIVSIIMFCYNAYTLAFLSVISYLSVWAAFANEFVGYVPLPEKYQQQFGITVPEGKIVLVHQNYLEELNKANQVKTTKEVWFYEFKKRC